MKICKIEPSITRYQVTFTPEETAALKRTRRWHNAVSTRSAENNSRPLYGTATLTKSQISQICDELGVNGRERFDEMLADFVKRQ